MTPGKLLHHIQLDIIAKLCEQSPQRFTQLHPLEIPNNVFSYHLKKALESGYIVQTNSNAYEPTRKARKLLSYVDSSTRHNTSPKMITMLLVKDTSGRILLLRRNSQPFPHWYGLPSGMVHSDERLEDAARRELAEKTGIRSSRPLRFIGVLDFRYLQVDSNDVFLHAVAFVYSHTVRVADSVQLPKHSYKWSNLGHAQILPEVNAVRIMDTTPNGGITSLNFIEPPEAWDEIKTPE